MQKITLVLVLTTLSIFLNSCFGVRYSSIAEEGPYQLQKMIPISTKYKPHHVTELSDETVLFVTKNDDDDEIWQLEELNLEKQTIAKRKSFRVIDEEIVASIKRQGEFITLLSYAKSSPYDMKEKTVITRRFNASTYELLDAQILFTTMSKKDFDYEEFKAKDNRNKYLPVSPTAFLSNDDAVDEVYTFINLISSDSTKYLFGRVLEMENETVVFEGLIYDLNDNSSKIIRHNYGKADSDVINEKCFNLTHYLFNNGDYIIARKMLDDGDLHSYEFTRLSGSNTKSTVLPLSLVKKIPNDEKIRNDGELIWEPNSKQPVFVGILETDEFLNVYKATFNFDKEEVTSIQKFEYDEKTLDSLDFECAEKYGVSPLSKFAPNGDLILILEFVANEYITVTNRNGGSHTVFVGVSSMCRNIYSLNSEFKPNWLSRNDERKISVNSGFTLSKDSYSQLKFLGEKTAILTTVDTEPEAGLFLEHIDLTNGKTLKKQRVLDFSSGADVEPGGLMMFRDWLIYHDYDNEEEIGVFKFKR